MHAVVIPEEEIAAIVSEIGDACDGHPAVTILVALSDMLASIADLSQDLTVDKVLSDFNALVHQRHGHNGNATLN